MSTAIATQARPGLRAAMKTKAKATTMLFGSVLAIGIPALALNPIAKMIQNFGITYELAALVISLISAGSFIGFVFPPVIPVTATVAVLITTFGTAFAIGW